MNKSNKIDKTKETEGNIIKYYISLSICSGIVTVKNKVIIDSEPCFKRWINKEFDNFINHYIAKYELYMIAILEEGNDKN